MAYSAFESAFVAILFTKLTRWGGERTRRCTSCDGERTTTKRGPKREARVRWGYGRGGATGAVERELEVELGVKALSHASSPQRYSITMRSVCALEIASGHRLHPRPNSYPVRFSVTFPRSAV